MNDPIEDDRLMRGLLEGELPVQDLPTALQRVREDSVFREQLLDLAAVRALLPALRGAVAAPPPPECAAIRKLFEDYRSGRAGVSDVGRLSGHLAKCPTCALAYEVSTPQHLAAEQRRPPSQKPRSTKRAWRRGAAVVLSLGALASISPISPISPHTAEAPTTKPFVADPRQVALEDSLAALENTKDEQDRRRIIFRMRRFADLIPEARLWAMAKKEKSAKCRSGLYGLRDGTPMLDNAQYRHALERELKECKYRRSEEDCGSLKALIIRISELETSIGEDYMLDVMARLASPDNGYPEAILESSILVSYYAFQYSDKVLAHISGIATTHPSSKTRTVADFVSAGLFAKRGDYAALAEKIELFLPRLVSADADIRHSAQVAIERHGDPRRLLVAAGRAWGTSPKLAISIGIEAGRKMLKTAMAEQAENRSKVVPPDKANQQTGPESAPTIDA